MLNPSGLAQDDVNAAVQSTTRPGGTLLQPSPGYDTIRLGKNRFQSNRGHTGGFRPMTFAEDIGGTGAALAVIPGDTAPIEASEWVGQGDGAVIISDRPTEATSGFAEILHEAYNTIPDMGDRTADRPRSVQHWLGQARAMYRHSPAVTVAAALGALMLVNIVARDVERSASGYRPRGVGSAVTDAPAAATQAGGSSVDDVAKAGSDAMRGIGEAADKAVADIGRAADSAVSRIERATGA
jgi:hypothetical protein